MRFQNFLGILNSCISHSSEFCEVPSNKLCHNTLTLLREKGLIWGFSFISKFNKKMYPLVKIYLKKSAMRKIFIYKKTSKLSEAKSSTFGTLLILSNPEGLSMSNIILYSKKRRQRILAKVLI